ncbi:hypothetical protein PFISCL1PPCAC_8635 [Pristionchus fissidentatus]|uniref:TOG domain-containing protein n=1 Tax=Pristionchus fissidentatus TaxID=1538716 RepID=A0AAV5VGF0_9BILA|nr:hypothetical protein PFISCL1PPCAC_8635 [Pristionchus fissidentatus]
MSWLAALLERNSGDPRARLDLGAEMLERMRTSRLPPDSGLLNDFCDLCVQWISASNYKVALLAFDLLEVAVQESGEVVAAYVLERSPAIVERLGDSKSTVRDASASLLTRLAYTPRSSPQTLLDKLTPGFSHRQWLVRTGSMGVFCGILEECRDAVEVHTMRLVPTFSKLLADPNAEVREAAAKTLAHVFAVIGPPAETRARGLVPEAKLNLLAARARELAIRSVSQTLNRYNGDRHSPSTPGGSNRHTPSLASRASPHSSMFKAPHLPNGRPAGAPHQHQQEEQENRRTAAASGGMSTVPRSASGTIRRPTAGAPSSGTIGAVNEDDFRKNFAAGVKVSIYDERALRTEMGKARDIMADDKQDWSKRTNAIKMFRGVWQNGGRDFEDLYLQEVLQSEEAILVSIKDLRSQVCREACLTVSYFCEELGMGLLRLAEAILPSLIALIQNSAKVMSTSGILACYFIVKNIQHPKLIPIFLSGVSSKSKEIRRETQAFVCAVLEWDTKKLEKSVPQLVDCIKAGLGDADPGARTSARTAYARLEASFPRSAEMLYKSLDPSKQRALAGGSASQSSSTQSIVSEKDGFALNHRPGTFGLQKQKAYYGGRSTSEIDPAAARRAGMTPPRRVIPGGVAAAMRKMTTPVGAARTPLSAGLPPSGSSSTFGSASRMMRSTTPSGMAGSGGGSSNGGSGAGTVSQPGSRSTSPSGLHSRIPGVTTTRGVGGGGGRGAMTMGRTNGTTSRDASPMRRAPSRGYEATDGPRKFSLDPMFDDVPTPVRSVSLGTAGSPRTSSVDSAAVTDALRAAASSAPNERRDGINSLKACIQNPAPLDAHYVVKIREALTKMLADGNSKFLPPALDLLECFLLSYHAELVDWLPSLLIKLLTKQANEILPMMQSHLARTMAVVRSSFDARRQLLALCRAIKNPVSVFNTKVRGVILAYMRELVQAADGLSISEDDVRLAVSKVLSWAQDPKCASIVGQCEQLVLDLFHANEAEFSALVDGLPPAEKDYARRLCRARSNSVRDDISQVTTQIADFVLSSRGSNRSPLQSSPSLGSSTAQSHSPYGSNAVVSPLARHPPTAAAATAPTTANNRHIAVIKPSTKQATTASIVPRESSGTTISDLGSDFKYGCSMTLHLKDDLPAQQDAIHRAREEISNSSKPADQTRALQGLHSMISEGSFTLWDANFKPLLLSVFGILSDSTVCEDVMRLALKLMTKLCLAQAARLNTNAEACVLKVLDVGASADWGTQVTVAAEECARTLATHLPPQVVIRVLNPIVEAEGEGRKALALKMLPTLVDHLDSAELLGYLPDIVPGIVQAYDSGKESSVRKAAVFALVSLHNKLGNEVLAPYVATLESSRLRLMEVYISRSQTASNHF